MKDEEEETKKPTRPDLEASSLREEHVDEERLKPGFLCGSKLDVESVLLGVSEVTRKRTKERKVSFCSRSRHAPPSLREDVQDSRVEEEEEK